MKRVLSLLARALHHWQGRTAAVITLVLFAEAQLIPVLPIQASARQWLFDRYQRLLPRQPQSQPVTIVAIDENSLKQVGQWPWPRNRDAQLIRQIVAMQPAAIGLDIYFPEADATSPEALAKNLPPQAAELARRLNQLPSHDAQLAEAMRQAPVVLGAAGFDFPTLTTVSGLRLKPLNIEGGTEAEALSALHNYPYVLASLPRLQAAASGQALLTVDIGDGVVRRIPLLAAVNGQAASGLALEMLRVASGAQAVTARLDRHGIRQLEVADLSVPVQTDGGIWLYFSRHAGERFVSAAEVLAGRVDPERLRGKLVLVGLTGSGLMDMRVTPLGEQMAGIEIQGQVLENLFDRQYLLRPWWLPGLETLALLLVGLWLSWVTPDLPPRRSSRHAAFLALLVLAVGFAQFYWLGWLFDALNVLVGSACVYGVLLGSVFVDTDQKRRAAEAALQSERLATARYAGELDAARTIQLGSLPDPHRVFAAETRFEIAALLEPAREVGGDLYDFFMLDQRRMFFMIGDVTGKGVPASLFMVVAKALAKSAALRGGAATDIRQVVETANREIARDNPAHLFVTSIAGILDADSGAVEFIVAGHDPPWRIGPGANGGVEKLVVEGGLPLCVSDEFPYPVMRLQLVAGDALLLTTDGVTEAQNAQRELYGSARLDAALNAAARAASFQTLTANDLLNQVREDVRRFVLAADPWDDLTLLVLRWQGPALHLTA